MPTRASSLMKVFMFLLGLQPVDTLTRGAQGGDTPAGGAAAPACGGRRFHWLMDAVGADDVLGAGT